MSYTHYRTLQTAQERVSTERAAGRMSYILKLRSGCYEVRVW